ncbi:3-deoxy-D-manno-octulosonic acid transferase [Marimonas lutisalis]|uniref:3-deoxy-D-manno-octulosonic acid transferase n=1 Tax=Marimonas lutisalis TaxID=2545756 RepID=UPI0010F9F938|nr:glycosyltransferase N-terminal domain-containing protein [Marimonas lutisalis]
MRAFGRSISLAAYLALARRGAKAALEFPQERPDGHLIWGHATSPERAAALLQLIARLRVQRPEIHFLLTTPSNDPAPDHLRKRDIWQVLPDDTTGESEKFLSHWRPDLGLWTGGYFRPAVIEVAKRRELPMFLIDAGEEGFNAAHQRWLPEIARSNLEAFSAVFARSGTAAQILRRLGVPEEEITVTGPLQEGGMALACNEEEREDLAQSLAGRPVWLAAMVQPEELDDILEAHRLSSRMAHRQLLILVPDDETEGARMARRIRAKGFNLAVWSEGEMPDEATQVLLADTRGEMGLWYRLAPVTFMASSLKSGHGGRDPFEPAALGSAILYGPNVGRYLSAYSRLATAGAARIVKDSETLSAALQQLTAPDRVAQMAAAGWEVASQGAEATDRIVDLVQDTLDVMEAG